VNRPPERAYAEMLLRRGEPATMLTSAGQLPAVIVFLRDHDGPWPEWLVEAFGGMVLPRLPDVTADLVVWVGVGRAAALASVVVTRAISRASGLLHPDTEETWRALLAFARLASVTPPDPEGRQPKAAFSEMRRLAARIESVLERRTAGHADVVSGLAQLVTLKIKDGTLAGDLRLLTADEFDQPVRLPGSASGLESPVGEEVQVPPMPPAELDEAIAAYQVITAMTPEERAGWVRRVVRDPALLVAGMPDEARLFMSWCIERWASEPDRLQGRARFTRAVEAAQWIEDLRVTNALPGRKLEAPGVDPALLEALAATRLTVRLDGQAGGSDAGSVIPSGARFTWDKADFTRRLTGA
jgi:hypothetical protein